MNMQMIAGPSHMLPTTLCVAAATPYFGIMRASRVRRPDRLRLIDQPQSARSSGLTAESASATRPSEPRSVIADMIPGGDLYVPILIVRASLKV